MGVVVLSRVRLPTGRLGPSRWGRQGLGAFIPVVGLTGDAGCSITGVNYSKFSNIYEEEKNISEEKLTCNEGLAEFQMFWMFFLMILQVVGGRGEVSEQSVEDTLPSECASYVGI